MKTAYWRDALPRLSAIRLQRSLRVETSWGWPTPLFSTIPLPAKDRTTRPAVPTFTWKVNVGTAGRVVRSLTGKGIVENNGVGHPQDVSTRRERCNRIADSRGKASRQYAVFIREFDIAAPLRLPGKKSFEDILAAGKMLSGSLHIRPAVHRPARNSFKHHNLARTAGGQRGKNKVLADIRKQVEADRRIRLSRVHIPDIGQSQATLRFGERRTVGVALEQLSDGAFTT